MPLPYNFILFYRLIRGENYKVRNFLSRNFIHSFATSCFWHLPHLHDVKEVKNKKIKLLKYSELFFVGDKGTIRWMWRKSVVGRLHRWRSDDIVSGQFLVCWSSDFNWIPLYIHIAAYFSLAPDLVERKFCIIPVASLDPNMFQQCVFILPLILQQFAGSHYHQQLYHPYRPHHDD